MCSGETCMPFSPKQIHSATTLASSLSAIGAIMSFANLSATSTSQAVAGEMQDSRVPVQRDAEPALRFGVDFRAKPTQDIHYILHFEIGVERMGEDRVENFALMVIHGLASLPASGL